MKGIDCMKAMKISGLVKSKRRSSDLIIRLVAGERDADENRKQMREEQRKSFEFRNAEGKCQRDL